MITITSEYLDANWQALMQHSVLPTQFSAWDDGDAYTLAEIGVLPSRKSAFGAVVVGEIRPPNFSIVIRLREGAGGDEKSRYRSPSGTQYEVTAEVVKDQGIESVSVHVESIDKSLSSRRRGLLETDILKGKRVLVIGLGTGGITVALELAKAGVGHFILVDPDRLEMGNVSRHSAGISFVGRKKVEAAKDLLLDKNPAIVVEAHPVRADYENEDLLRKLVGASDLVICATDNRPSKLFINSLCFDAKKMVIFGGAFRRAYGGQVLRVRPGESACYQCLVLAMPEKEADQEISSEADAEAIAYSDRPVPVEPGLSMDVAPVSIMVSKLALQELISDTASTLHMLDKDLNASLYRWGNRPEPGTDYASCPPLSESIDEITILRWYGIYLEKDPGCPTCGNFEKAIRQNYKIDLDAPSLPTLPLSSGLQGDKDSET